MTTFPKEMASHFAEPGLAERATLQFNVGDQKERRMRPQPISTPARKETL